MKIHEVTVSKDKVSIDATCFQCKTTHHFILNKDQYLDWQIGMRIQNAFPEMDPDTRELLISGICGTCFDNLFGEE